MQVCQNTIVTGYEYEVFQKCFIFVLPHAVKVLHVIAIINYLSIYEYCMSDDGKKFCQVLHPEPRTDLDAVGLDIVKDGYGEGVSCYTSSELQLFRVGTWQVQITRELASYSLLPSSSLS